MRKIIKYTALMTLGLTIAPAYSSLSENYTISASSISKKKLKKVNKEMKAYLQEDQGFAEGTLDENGNPTDNGTPNPEFNYATYVQKIKITETKQAKVYYNSKITDLTVDELDEVSSKVQGMITACLVENKYISDEQAVDGTFLTFYYGKNAIGHSKLSNYKEFKWYTK
ncbi:hypothetical protein FGO85_01345 [Ligilactobacillus salivarius]|uniref:hypothetical protein n=1 Tax=Ligilactobacillus salivarius TaxID=1624 RepID=UPI0011CABB44|nr:hypothetical protein [Ligilactobacillus salivarius]TXJ78227.1 hypothetical protein FGO85_01345 [Ligilactobacillus salivarius]